MVERNGTNKMKLFNKFKPIKKLKQFTFTLAGYTGGLGSSWGSFSTNTAFQYYREMSWIYACVNLRSSAIASVPWIIERKTKDGWEKDENHELYRILNRPNPRLDMSTMFKFSIQHLDLQGNAYWLKVRRTTGGGILELWPYPPGQISPVLENGVLKYYQPAGGGDKVEIENIVHLIYTNPQSIYVGQSPLQAAMRAAETDRKAEEWQKNSMDNRAVPDGVMVFEDIQTEWQHEQAKKELKELYQGSDNARRPVVVGGKAKWTPMSLSAAEMDFIQSRKMTREEILAVYGIPHPMVGIYDKATLANIETARVIFWKDTIIPILDEIQSELNLQLAWSEYGDDIRIRHDVSEIDAMQDSLTDNITNAKGLWSMGVPFNEINKRLGLGFDDLEGGDAGYIPGGLIPTDLEFNVNVDNSNADDLKMLAYGR